MFAVRAGLEHPRERDLGQQIRHPGQLRDGLGALGAVDEVRLEGLTVFGAEGAHHIGGVVLGERVDVVAHGVTPISCMARRSARSA